jgi:hypothetical protein
MRPPPTACDGGPWSVGLVLPQCLVRPPSPTGRPPCGKAVLPPSFVLPLPPSLKCRWSGALPSLPPAALRSVHCVLQAAVVCRAGAWQRGATGDTAAMASGEGSLMQRSAAVWWGVVWCGGR